MQMAVSFESAAAANHNAAAQGFRSRSGSAYTSPHSEQAAAKISACASELCANQIGYSPVSTTVQNATSGTPTSRIASRHTASSPSEATISTASRVTSGKKPEAFHQSAR